MRRESTRPPTQDALHTQLKSKGRTRRHLLKRLAAASPGALRNDIAPELRLVQRAIADLVYPDRNVRKLDVAHVREIAASISTLGFCAPPIIDQADRVINGVASVEAARSIGMTHIPCIVADHLSATERRLLRAAINRLQEKGAWDLDTLRLEFDELILEAPVEITGFTGAEIDHILMDDEAIGFEEGPLVPAPNAVAVSRLGDVFHLGEHVVICGDATDPEVLARLMPDETARLVLTDVPYNVKIAGNVTRRDHREFPMASGEMSGSEFHAFNAAWMKACLPYLQDGALVGTFIDWRGYPTVDSAALQLGLAALNLIVWTKSNAGMGSLYRSQHELFPLYKNGAAAHVNNIQLGKHGRWRSNVWPYAGASTIGSEARKGIQEHPTVKPVAMLHDALLDLTHRGEIVLDPFLGSGSTLMAAEKAGRRCRGVELDPLYVDVAVKRYEAATGMSAEVALTGESFAALAEGRALERATAAGPQGVDQ